MLHPTPKVGYAHPCARISYAYVTVSSHEMLAFSMCTAKDNPGFGSHHIHETAGPCLVHCSVVQLAQWVVHETSQEISSTVTLRHQANININDRRPLSKQMGVGWKRERERESENRRKAAETNRSAAVQCVATPVSLGRYHRWRKQQVKQINKNIAT